MDREKVTSFTMNARGKTDNKNKFLSVLDKILPEGKITEKFVVNLSLVLLFITSFIYYYTFGNYIFYHQENNSLFIFSGEYFQRFAVKPGGLLVYAANFLTQWYFNVFYGSLILSALLIMLCVVLVKIYKRLSIVSHFFLIFILVPPCTLLLLQTHFGLSLQYNLGYLLVAIWFLVSIIPRKKIFRFVIMGLFPLFYYLAGSFSLIYLGMYTLYYIIFEKGILRIYPAVLLSIALLTFFLFKEVIFLQPVNLLLGYPVTLYGSSVITLYVDFLSGFMVLFPVFIATSSQFNVNRKFAGVVPVAVILIVFPATVYLLFKVYDPALSNLEKLEESFHKRDWDAVIRRHEKFPSTSIYGQYYYNLALSEKGQLCERLFFGLQSFGPMSLTLPPDIEQAGRTVYFYYAVGLISEAHHLAYELMVVHGYRPEILKLLIKTELINGNYKIAGRYINVLKKTFHYKRWAKEYERMVFDPALIKADPELGDKITMLPRGDFFIGTNDVQNIDSLLKNNPGNKRAFEYKMARLLLEKDFVEVVNEVKNMKKIGYTDIPRCIEEAIVEFINVTREVPDMGGLLLKPAIKQRFIQYITDYNSYGKSKSLLEKHMTRAEKNTFWYYLQNNTISKDLLRSNPSDNNVY